MAIISRKITRKKLLFLLAAISLVSLALEVRLFVSVYDEDDAVPQLSVHSVTIAPSQSSPTSAPTSISFVQTSTQPPLTQSFTTELTTASKAAKGATSRENYNMPSEIRDAFSGRVPERVVIPEGEENIHFSLRTGSSSYDHRFPIVFLTWVQTIAPHNVSRFSSLVFKNNDKQPFHVFVYEM